MAIYTPREMNCLTEDGPPRAVIPETEMTGLLAPAKFRLFLPVVCISLKFLELSSWSRENVLRLNIDVARLD